MALRTPLSVTPHLYMGDSTGRPLDKGVVYFGEQDKDPEYYPITLYSDDALTLPLMQPVHTKGGYLYDKGDMVEPHAKEIIYSVKVLDSYGRKVFYKGAMMRNSWNDDVIEQINAALASTAEEAAQIATDVAKEIADKAVISSGFVTIDSFELGATITQRNQALRHAADGKLYRWAGELPKVVSANSTPTSSGGIGDNAWLEVSDVTLRQEIDVAGGIVKIKHSQVGVEVLSDLVAADWLEIGMIVSTKGYYTADDGGGNDYEIVAAGTGTDDGGSFIDLSGSGLQAKRLSHGSFVSPMDFGGDSTLMNAYLNTFLESERTRESTFAVNPAAKLKISSFVKSTKPFDDYTVDIQAAINVLMSNTKYRELDLEGRIWSITSTLNLDVDRLSNSNFDGPKVISNGTLHVTGDWTLGTGDPVFDVFSPSAHRLERIFFKGVNIKCNKRASGIRYRDGVFHNNKILFCNIHDPADYGVRATDNLIGNGLYIGFTNIERFDAGTPFASRTTIGIDLGIGDTKVIGCNVQYCLTAFKSSSQSQTIIGNHFYQPQSGVAQQTGNTPVIHFTVRPNSIITGNYIDNGYVLVEGDGYLSMTSNLFTYAGVDGSQCFIEITSDDPATPWLKHIVVTGNQFRVLGDSATLTKPFIKTGSTPWDIYGSVNVSVKDNYFWGPVIHQTTHPKFIINLSTPTVSWDIDASANTAFNLSSAHRCDSIGLRTSGRVNNPGSYWFNRVTGGTGRLELENAVEGVAIVTLNVNASELGVG